jgi:hypothetical protein
VLLYSANVCAVLEGRKEKSRDLRFRLPVGKRGRKHIFSPILFKIGKKTLLL